MLKDKDQFQIEIINSQEVYQIQEGKTSGAFWLASASVAIGGLQKPYSMFTLLYCNIYHLSNIYGFFSLEDPVKDITLWLHQFQ